MARILVIEDEADIRQVLDYNLKSAGHEVVEASRGADGLRLIREREPDLVLLDLVLRIRAVLRRRELPAGEAASIEFGNLRIDRAAHRVWVDGEEVELTALEFKLLVTLYERRNRVQSRGALLDQVWGIETKISTRTVDAHVKRLREKMGNARDYIETVRGVGYRFAEIPVSEALGAS